VLFLIQQACALDPAWITSQYLRDRWDSNNGFVGGQVNAIAQTKDGYLWIGAERGLYRYDGHRFVVVGQQNSEPPEIKSVLGLAAEDNGDLWIRMEGPNLWRYQNGTLRDVLSDNGLREKDLTTEHVTAMSRCDDGSILFSLRSPTFNGLYRYRNGKLEALTSRDVLRNDIVVSVALTADGTVWLGTRDDGLFYLKNGTAVSAMNDPADEKINSLLPLEDGALLIGTDRGIARWEKGRITQMYGKPFFRGAPVVAMMKDRASNVWVGTEGGLFRLNAKGASRVDVPVDDSGERITALFEGREGNVWVGSTSGFARLRNGAFLTFSTEQGLPSDSNGPIYVDAMQRVWFAPTEGGLYRMRDGKVEPVKIDGLNRGGVYSIVGDKNDLWIGRREAGLSHLSLHGEAITVKTYKQADGLAQNNIYTVLRSHDGTVWAGTPSGGLSRLRDGKFLTYTRKDGLGANIIYSIVEVRDGTIWVGTAGGLSTFSNGKWSNLVAEDGLPSDDVISLHEDSEGVLWIGTTFGLAYLASGDIHSVRDADPSLREPVLGLTDDDVGSLWIATSNHILRINRRDLLKGRLAQGSIREYGIDDGLLQVGGVRRDRSVVNDGQGRIWFSTGRGLSVVDWRKQRINSPPAIVHIDGISSDENPVALTSTTRIPASPRRVMIDYTGLNLSAPDRVRFQYKLDGFDPGWTETTAERQAIYTNLPPGPYRFAVRASNDDGLWNGPEAVIAFRIEHAFWQTWWFQLLCVLTVMYVALLFYRSQMRQVTRQLNARFNERMEERTRIAHELHDTLLQGFLSASMQLHVATENVPEDSIAKPQLNHILELMARVSEEGRNALQGLRSSPAEPPSLEKALSSIPRALAIPEETKYRVVVDGQARPLHPVIHDEVYFIGREALVNAVRHARASSIEVELEYKEANFLIVVRDNGCGIDADVLKSGKDGHWGLPGMRERAEGIGAELRLFSRSGAGTEVALSVPGAIAYQQSRKGWNRILIDLFSIRFGAQKSKR